MRGTVVVLFFSFILTGWSGFSQENRLAHLYEIAALENDRIEESNIRVRKFLEENSLTDRWIRLEDGRQAYLRNVIEGVPYYIATLNLEARRTTGVDYLARDLGDEFDLKGEGIVVGVWDGGQVYKDHVELIGRVENKNGSPFDNHATHVTGTIIAEGLNEQAMGMAPKAKAIAYYAFQDDLGPMAIEAANGLILSNHSYSLLLGWEWNGNNWQWYGGSGDIDNRFGHYSATSRTIDDIAYNAPYYTAVFAVGNDRNDEGDGTKPPDGPYNIVSPRSASKNVLSVGAITGFDNYEDVGSAVMSSFSAWGPTNDGRIKPDLVADGVGVLSTGSGSENSYVTLQGTSMSTPNVTGSLALIQEYFRSQSDTFMTSAALKALAIHTAREAGSKEGPDPMYGWGVLNTVDALKVLRDRDEQDTLLFERSITSGDTFEFEVFSDGETPIVATVAWTDPPGTPGSPGNDNPMLVNDLDIRIIDDEANVELPWVLNISNPTKTEKADNDRDNVEKVEFNAPMVRRYRIVISHKGELVDGKQDFGLVITSGSIDVNSSKEYYWVAGSGEIMNANNWSSISNGQNLTSLDLTTSTVVFDNNASLTSQDIITLSQDLSVANLVWLNEQEAILDLQGNTLSVTNNLNVQSSNLTIRNGTLEFSSNNQKTLSLDFRTENLSMVFNNAVGTEIISNIKVENLTMNGRVDILGREIEVANIIIGEGGAPALFNNNISVSESVQFTTTSPNFRSNLWQINEGFISGVNTSIADKMILLGSNVLNNRIQLSSLEVLGSLFSSNASIETDTLILRQGATLEITNGDSLSINSSFEIDSSPEAPVNLIGGTSESIIDVRYRDLICLEYINVSNFALSGNAVINIAESGTLINSTNFFSGECSEIIYPNFSINETDRCLNSLIPIQDLSVGPIDVYSWETEDGIVLQGEDQTKPVVYFDEKGIYSIKLTVSNASTTLDYISTIEIDTNNLKEVKVVKNSTGLVSDQEGIAYQWFKDGAILPEATDRFYTPNASGAYQVAYFVDGVGCKNRVSMPFNEIISSVNEDFIEPQLGLYPNPATAVLYIKGLVGDFEGRVINSKGQIKQKFTSENFKGYINIQNLSTGLYILEIISNEKKAISRFVKSQ